jgi:hypothetical protein
MKYALIGLLAALLAACGDGDSDKSTYNTCRITDSGALLAAERANDIAQCWDIRHTKDKNDALGQCNTLVSSYMGRNYTFGHDITYQVSSSACPPSP